MVVRQLRRRVVEPVRPHLQVGHSFRRESHRQRVVEHRPVACDFSGSAKLPFRSNNELVGPAWEVMLSP